MTGPGQISEVHERPVCSGALAQRPRRRSVSKKARRDGKEVYYRIEDEDGRIFEHGTGDRDSLALSATELDTTFANESIETIGQFCDELCGICHVSSSFYYLTAGIKSAVRDILC